MPATFSMPPTGGAYPTPPYVFETLDCMTLVFHTDAEAVSGLLPPGLVLKEPARGILTVVRHLTNPLGPYNEAFLAVRADWQGETLIFNLFCVVDNSVAMLAGREIWGMPKKLGVVNVAFDEDVYHASVERPSGVRVCEVVAHLGASDDRPAYDSERSPSAAFLKQIPSCEPTGEPLVQLVAMERGQYRYLDAPAAPVSWEAEAQARVFSPSPQDPWALVPILSVQSARYTRGGGRYLGFGRVLHDYSPLQTNTAPSGQRESQ